MSILGELRWYLNVERWRVHAHVHDLRHARCFLRLSASHRCGRCNAVDDITAIWASLSSRSSMIRVISVRPHHTTRHLLADNDESCGAGLTVVQTQRVSVSQMSTAHFLWPAGGWSQPKYAPYGPICCLAMEHRKQCYLLTQKKLSRLSQCVSEVYAYT